MHEFDRVDRKILDILQRDGRISITDLAQAVGLSATPCAERVRRLERNGVITGYHARVSPQALGKTLLVFLEIKLSAKEFNLLEAFMNRPEQVLSRDRLLEHAWDFAYEPRSNVVDVYVRYLREKIDRPFGRTSLETVRGLGYRLRADG